MPVRPLPGNLQECMITLLAHSDEYGRIVAHAVPAHLYEGDYQLVAERCVDYWRREGCAPGIHVDDILDDMLTSSRGPSLRRVLATAREMAGSVNGRYAIDRVHNFRYQQELKLAVLEAAEVLSSGAPDADERAEELLGAVRRARDAGFDPGVRLSEFDRMLAVETEHREEFDWGIAPLDRARVVPERGTITTIIAPPGYGKSWALVHAGKRAVLRRRRVLHVTLELAWHKTLRRYYQSLYAVPRRHVDNVEVTTLEWDNGTLSRLGRERVDVDFSLDSPDVRLELEAHNRPLGARTGNLLVKEFPSGTLTVSALRAYMDQLEVVEGWVPDMLVIDYPKIMRIDQRDVRVSIGATFVELRGLCQERNMAGVLAHQSSKAGTESHEVRATHAAEDYSVIHTSDNVITYSATRAEQRHGLARLLVDKARDEESNIAVLITQSYKIGQFCIDSAPMRTEYFEHLEQLGRSGDDRES